MIMNKYFVVPTSSWLRDQLDAILLAATKYGTFAMCGWAYCVLHDAATSRPLMCVVLYVETIEGRTYDYILDSVSDDAVKRLRKRARFFFSVGCPDQP